MSIKVKGEAIKEGSIPLSALASGDVLLKNMDKGNPYFYLTEDNVYYDLPYANVVYLSTDKYPGVLELVKYNKVLLTNGPTSEVIWDDNGIKIDGNAAYYNIGILYSANPIVPVIETPDWNAKEGEAGYVENRTHYMDYNLDAIPSIVNVPLLDELGDYYTFEFNYIKLPEDWFNIENDTIRLLKPLIFKVDTPDYSDEWNYDDYNDHNIPYKTSFGDEYISNSDIGGDNAFIIYIHDNDVYKDGLYFDLSLINSKQVLKVKHLGVKTLDDKYLPDTVVKTTPQTLSDTDKNQALANLGIDPVVWKYMCDPCEIYVSDCYDDNINNVPEDIIPIIFNEGGTPNKNLLNLCVFKIPVGTTEYLAKPTYIEDNSYIHVNIEGIALYYEQSDNAIYMSS